MKIKIYILTILSLLTFILRAESQTFTSRGIIVNQGTIIIKDLNSVRLESGTVENSGTITMSDNPNGVFIEPGSNFINSGEFNLFNTLNCNGNINNENGYLQLNYNGGTVLAQDAISGLVDFNNTSNFQVIPMLSFDSVAFSGSSKRFDYDNTRNQKFLEARSYFSSNNNTQLTYQSDTIEIHSQKITDHSGQIKNFSSPTAWFRQNSDSLNAELGGSGSFIQYDLDNPNGVDVVSNDIYIEKVLQLSRGEMKNTPANNFTMGDQSTIYRKPQGSIASEAKWEGTVAVLYNGVATVALKTGGEIPVARNILTDIEVENSGGIELTQDIYASDRITLRDGNIYTDEDLDGNGSRETEHTLYLINSDNTALTFENKNFEIIGAFAKTNLVLDEGMVFNNAYTKMSLGELGSDNGDIDTLIVRVTPDFDWSGGEFGEVDNVRRKFEISAKNNNNDNVTSLNSATFGYAWRHFEDANPPPESETPVAGEFTFGEAQLVRWDPTQDSWFDQGESGTILTDFDANWAYGDAALLGELGEFAVGVSAVKFLRMIASAMLEGPYRGLGIYSDASTTLTQEIPLMGTELTDQDIFPLSAPNEYPYNLDPARTSATLSVVPENVVDWIVVEFRNKALEGDIGDPLQSFFKTCLLRSDGMLLDLDGSTEVLIHQEDTQTPENPDGIDVRGKTPYYVVIRHRNHLSVVTSEPVSLSARKTSADPNNLTLSPTDLIGDIQVLGLDDSGSKIFGMIAGNVDHDRLTLLDEQIINEETFEDDKQAIWNQIGLAGYMREDVNMDGMVSTKDYNISWNNRGRYTLVKELK
jgi:hypothetical protein